MLDNLGLIGTVEAALAGDYTGPMPQEWIDWLLVRETGWTWQQVQQAPVYIRTVFTAFIAAEAVARARELDKTRPATAAERHAQQQQAEDVIAQARRNLGLDD